MMGRNTGWVIVILFLLVCGGCAKKLETYEPRSSTEGEIKSVLVSYVDAWNRHDVAGVMALWHNDAEIMYGSERKTASKERYRDLLPERMENTPTIRFGSPSIAVMDGKAVAKLRMDTGRFKMPVTFHLVEENDRWFLMRWRY
jgi:ketosteroid isomerase-like protein